jgi:uncharacterized membrane protein YjfL (UPF0719 family)
MEHFGETKERLGQGTTIILVVFIFIIVIAIAGFSVYTKYKLEQEAIKRGNTGTAFAIAAAPVAAEALRDL